MQNSWLVVSGIFLLLVVPAVFWLGYRAGRHAVIGTFQQILLRIRELMVQQNWDELHRFFHELVDGAPPAGSPEHPLSDDWKGRRDKERVRYTQQR